RARDWSITGRLAGLRGRGRRPPWPPPGRAPRLRQDRPGAAMPCEGRPGRAPRPRRPPGRPGASVLFLSYENQVVVGVVVVLVVPVAGLHGHQERVDQGGQPVDLAG